MKHKDTGGQKVSFRKQLVLFGLLLVLIVLIPTLAFEVQRPWEALEERIGRAESNLAGVEAGFVTHELERMNAFALRMIEEAQGMQEDHLVWSFGMLLMDGRLLPESEVSRTLEEEEVEAELDYDSLTRAYAFWEDKFADDPGLLEIFRKYKRRLISTKENVRESGFMVEDVYVMVDDGKNLAFLLDGSEWFDATYPGLIYDVIEADAPYFRSYIESGPGYYSNPRHYHLKIFPKFDTDKWGSWFTVNYAVKTAGIYNNYAIDFDAAEIKRLIWTVGGALLGVTAFLFIIIAVIAQRMSKQISVPVENLVAGTEAVIRGDYDFRVPDDGSPEFKRPIRIFNQMLSDLK